jgi:hypothetical protein
MTLRLSRKTISRVRWGLLFLVIVVGISFLTWHFLPREQLLLEHAQRVADTTQWGAGGRRFNESIGNYWLSNQEVLFDRYEGTQHDDRVIYKRNIATGQETKLPGLTASREQLYAEVEDSQCVSPDGKWFLCSARWGECLLAEVNGTRHYLYPDAEGGLCYRKTLWLPDSRHWIERYGINAQTHRLLLHDTQNPKLSVPLPLKANSTAEAMDRVVPPDIAVVVDWPEEGMDDFGEPLVTADLPPTKQVPLSLVPWRAGGKPFAHYSVAVPFGLEHYHFEISPDAKHLAWQVTVQRPASLQAWLHRYLPVVKAVRYKTTAVWVSNIDGSNRHDLGHVLETANPSEDNEPQAESLLKELKWLPDSKHLSFEYKDALYVVPIF